MKSRKFYLWFTASLMLNAFGNNLMIMAHFGSPPWTGAGQNVAAVSPFSIGISMVALQLFALFLTYLTKTKLTIWIVMKSFAITFLFSLLIDLFMYIHSSLYIPDSFPIRVLYALIGLNCIAAGVSMYIRIGSILMPADYLLHSFSKLIGNYTIGTLCSQAIPVTISLIISLIEHKMMNGLGFGAIAAVLLNGVFIDLYNRIIKVPRQDELDRTA